MPDNDDLVCLRLPAFITDPVTPDLHESVAGLPVIAVATDPHQANPDESQLWLYGNLIPTPDTKLWDHHNDRASFFADTMIDDWAKRPNQIIVGDAFLLCTQEQAADLIQADRNFQKARLLTRAFASWLNDYISTNDSSFVEAYDILHHYIAGEVAHAHHEVGEEIAKDIAERLGLDPKQVGVVFL